MEKVTIYHNPNCSSSRNALALIRHVGIEPHIVHYLDTPLDEAMLKSLLKSMNASARDILRTNEPLYDELALAREMDNDELIAIMIANPILINRPIVVTEKGACLCRPLERFLEISPAPLKRIFVKESGEEILPGRCFSM
ncbi:MAG: arsenate reductase (glutaredoxin) [Wolinella sp.]